MDVEAIVGGSSLSLVVLAHDGLGMAPLHRLVERGPLQHGDTDVGFRLDPRIFSLVLALRGSSYSDLYSSHRKTLQDTFAPMGSLKLLFTLNDGSERQIDCDVIDAPLPHDARKEWAANVTAVRFRAPDPTLYDPTGKTVTFGLTGGGTGTQVPLEVPLEVGASALDQTVPITYAGNFRSLPWRIRILGPITDPVITNLMTDEKLDFTGTTIGAADYYDIDCRYGQKTVEDASGTNKIADLTDDSDLATFHLAAHPEADGGQNDINVTGSSVDGDTEIYFNYYERYLGI